MAELLGGFAPLPLCSRITANARRNPIPPNAASASRATMSTGIIFLQLLVSQARGGSAVTVITNRGDAVPEGILPPGTIGYRPFLSSRNCRKAATVFRLSPSAQSSAGDVPPEFSGKSREMKAYQEVALPSLQLKCCSGFYWIPKSGVNQCVLP